MICRQNCGACCIAPSINHPIPNMPQGKAAGETCVNLNKEDWSCKIWGKENYPDTCRNFLPETQVCGDTREDALLIISDLERKTI